MLSCRWDHPRRNPHLATSRTAHFPSPHLTPLLPEATTQATLLRVPSQIGGFCYFDSNGLILSFVVFITDQQRTTLKFESAQHLDPIMRNQLNDAHRLRKVSLTFHDLSMAFLGRPRPSATFHDLPCPP